MKLTDRKKHYRGCYRYAIEGMTYAERFTAEGGAIAAYVRSERAITEVERETFRSSVRYWFHFVDGSKAIVRWARLHQILRGMNQGRYRIPDGTSQMPLAKG